MVFFIGLFFFGEELQVDRLIGFILIWAGVLIFVGEIFSAAIPDIVLNSTNCQNDPI